MSRDTVQKSNNRSKLIIFSLFLTFSALFLYACDTGSSDEQLSGNQIQISLSCPDQNEISELSRNSGTLRTLEEIVTLILTVEGGNPPLNPIFAEFDADETVLSIDVPAGTGRIFTIEGLDINSNVICFGQTPPTDIDINTTDIDIGCDFVIEDCTDGIDNDFDGLIDCQDSDCEEICEPMGDSDDAGEDNAGDDDDDEIPSNEDDMAGECGDGIDNDQDGFADCDDNDCIRSIDCRPLPPPPPTGGGCPFIQGDGGPMPDCNNPACCGFQECICFNCELCNTCNQCFLVDETSFPLFCSNPEE